MVTTLVGTPDPEHESSIGDQYQDAAGFRRIITNIEVGEITYITLSHNHRLSLEYFQDNFTWTGKVLGDVSD